MPDVGTRKLVLLVDSTNFTSSVSKAEIGVGDSDTDFLSFTDALAGGAKEYTLSVQLKQNTDSTSLWYYAWNNVGEEVDFELWPNGDNPAASGTPTTTYPQITGTVVITEPDGKLIGGESSKSVTAKQVIEVAWTCTAKPTLNVA